MQITDLEGANFLLGEFGTGGALGAESLESFDREVDHGLDDDEGPSRLLHHGVMFLFLFRHISTARRLS